MPRRVGAGACDGNNAHPGVTFPHVAMKAAGSKGTGSIKRFSGNGSAKVTCRCCPSPAMKDTQTSGAASYGPAQRTCRMCFFCTRGPSTSGTCCATVTCKLAEGASATCTAVIVESELMFAQNKVMLARLSARSTCRIAPNSHWVSLKSRPLSFVQKAAMMAGSTATVLGAPLLLVTGGCPPIPGSGTFTP